MSVKASVSITEQQNEFARAAVADGHYSSLSAIVQRGLELVRKEHELHDAEVAALRQFLEERRKGPFIDDEAMRTQVQQMIADKRKDMKL